MLTETSFELNDLPDELDDLDLTETDEWIGVSKGNLIFPDRTVAMPKPIRFPRVAAIDPKTAIVVDCRSGGENNAWIISASGDILASFFAGDAIEDVIASDRFIVFTYFDESACTSAGIERNGVAIFDAQGNYLFGYRELFGIDAVDIVDCYAVCWGQQNQIYFFPYTDFPLVRFDLERRTQEKWDTPSELHGAHAISSRGSTVYFQAPYNDKSGLYAWKVGKQRSERIAERHSPLRGLRSGRFLAVGKTGFTISTPSE